MEGIKATLKQVLGVPFVGLVDPNEGHTVILCALCARELGERSIARGDEVILVGGACAAELDALERLGITAVCVSAECDAAELESALSPATKAVWVCADASVDAVCTVRNFCNALDLWMPATVTLPDARKCVFEGERYHVGAVADVATGRCEDASFVCTKDTLPYQLMVEAAAL